MDLREEIEKLLSSVTLSNHDTAVSAITGLGITDVKDLKDLTENDLMSVSIPLMDSRKMVKAFASKLNPKAKSMTESFSKKPPMPAPKDKPDFISLPEKKKIISHTQGFKSASEKKVVKLLVLGKSGAGKTTFINAFYNHVLKVGF